MSNMPDVVEAPEDCLDYYCPGCNKTIKSPLFAVWTYIKDGYGWGWIWTCPKCKANFEIEISKNETHVSDNP